MASLKQEVQDLRELLDQVESVLQDGYEVTASREELAETIGEALELISPEDSDDTGADEEELDDDG